MARKPKAEIIRVYDTVRIIKPLIFLRCGYPMTVKDEAKVVEEELGRKIAEFVCLHLPNHDDSFHLRMAAYELPDPLEAPRPEYYVGERRNIFDKIVREFAHYRCKQKKWGGRDRKIYTLEIPEMLGCQYSVMGVRYVKTGHYSPGSYSGGYWSDGDYDPPYLGDEKTHKILSINYYHGSNFQNAEIEAANVEKVQVEAKA